ncbi:NEDD4-binding protein 3-A [Gadus morhua]|uniref:NEDD4 binding protein 3 n=1 Tax=Gadus morhua TaxID=8049 RepID=A0A8C5F5J7_GADMO|nr:NEDD4-binding protein 3 [Gadus morhua]XP_030224357.1 NEDD4-binding protein 3 [Gadus morhua]
MAASVQTLPRTRNSSSKTFRSAPPLSSNCTMGSVGSLVERPDVSQTKNSRAMPQVRPRQSNGLLKKGFTQRDLLNYLNISRKEPRTNPGSRNKTEVISGCTSLNGLEDESLYTKVYNKDGTEIDVGKNSLPIGGKYGKTHFRPSAFKRVSPKNFSSMQNLYPTSPVEDLDYRNNGIPQAYGQPPPAVSSSSSSSSPSRHGRASNTTTITATSSAGHKALACLRGASQEDDNMSDSGHNSMNSLPPYRPPFRPHLSQISASTGHINTIGSLDRSCMGPRGVGPGGAVMGGDMAVTCRSMATLSHLTPCPGEAPPPYELPLSLSMEDVVRDLEERLVEKEYELKQMRRNLDESEGAIAQVFEGKQRLWEKEVDELKGLYAAKLRQLSQHAQRSQRSLQLQLYRAQQEKGRAQEELDSLRRVKGQEEEEEVGAVSPTLEETRWQVCQKSGEISLLKQQLRDSQAEVTQKLSEIFQLKTQLRETRGELRSREGQLDTLKTALQGTLQRRYTCLSQSHEEDAAAGGATGGVVAPVEDRLRAELLLERRQSEAQADAFEEERRTWQAEKDKVIRYQKELQASYLDMYHRSEALEAELHLARAGPEGWEKAGGGGGGEGRGGGGVAAGNSGSGSGTLERDGFPSESGRAEEDGRSSGLPWIERIESSEI